MKMIMALMAALFAQLSPVPSATDERATIEGIVVNSDGRPVVGAEVSAAWEPMPARFQVSDVPRASTGPDGKFVIALRPGTYRVSAHADGYVRQEFGATLSGLDGSRKGTVLSVKSGEKIRDVTVRLSPDSILAGRVTSTDGQPLLRMEVIALKRQFTVAGVSQMTGVGRTETNDRGEYRIAGLGPGKYYVRAASLPASRLRAEQFRQAARELGPQAEPTPGFYAPVFYPRAELVSDATTVEIKTGVEVRNIDFVLLKHRAYSIRGRVVDGATGGLPTRAPLISAQPAYYEYLPGSGSFADSYRPDGTFLLTDVAPGIYWIKAQISPALTPEQRAALTTLGGDTSQLPLPARGIALVRIVDADVENVELTIVHNLEVSGRLTVADERFDLARNYRNIKLQLRPVDGLGNGGPSEMSMTEDGQFVYRRLLPMEHRLTVSALPTGLYVKEARMGAVDALGESLMLTKPVQESFEIVLARGAEVSGTVVDESSRLRAGQQVVLIPDESRNRPDLYRTAMTDTSGQFVFQGVAPGNFRIYAWQNIEEFQYFDQAFVGRYRDAGSPVQVTGTAAFKANVRLIANEN